MRLRANLLKGNIKILEIVLKSTVSPENRMSIREIISVMSDFDKYTLRYIVNRETEKAVNDLCKEISECVASFDKIKDTSLIYEIDKLRGRALTLFDRLATYRGVFDAEAVVAEDDLSIIRNKLAIRIRDEEDCKSLTDADRRARVDPRYERALEDFRVLRRCSDTLKNKTPVMNALLQAMTQRISVGRMDMENGKSAAQQVDPTDRRPGF